MNTCTASAPGKIILFGEHAVVYGQPALAAPVHDLRATAHVAPGSPGSGLTIEAPDLDQRHALAGAAAHALALTAQLVLERLGEGEPDAHITVQSDIPVAGGLGSGAAVSAALARALAAYLGRPLENAELSALVYETEKVHHGTPSGIDNTVVCYGMPVYFVRGHEPEVFHPGKPFDLLIGDTGIPSPTHETVGAVREAWQREPSMYEATFTEIGAVVEVARSAIECGQTATLGPLMAENQALLRRLRVSSPELEQLIEAALAAGAGGAKLSGGGGGGNMIALVEQETVAQVRKALYRAGARRVIHTLVR